ncbi:hypothetical protein HY947_03545 [Candidatus Gottesmanbacteria bacterium]|nr:hypothetical protein [Candidatus Gottesmanbacteria bacterium]
MKKISEYFSWFVLLVFAGPTFMIIISWNSVPGDPLYKTKLYLEQTLVLLVSPSRDTATSLQMKYTERRLEEAKTLLSRDQSSEGLAYLQDQIVSTGTFIASSKTSADQSVQAAKYIETLQKVSKELEVQNRTITGTSSTNLLTANTSNQQINIGTQPISSPQQAVSNTSLSNATPLPQNQSALPSVGTAPSSTALANKPVVIQNTPLAVPTNSVIAAKPASVPSPTVSQVIVSHEIQATQEKIKETIKEMEKVKKDSEDNKSRNTKERDKQQKEEQKKSEDESRRINEKVSM